MSVSLSLLLVAPLFRRHVLGEIAQFQPCVAAALLRLHPSNLTHPFCQTPIKSSFSPVASQLPFRCDDTRESGCCKLPLKAPEENDEKLETNASLVAAENRSLWCHRYVSKVSDSTLSHMFILRVPHGWLVFVPFQNVQGPIWTTS